MIQTTGKTFDQLQAMGAKPVPANMPLKTSVPPVVQPAQSSMGGLTLEQLIAKESQGTPAAPSNQPTDVNANNATIPADNSANPLKIAGTTLANIPSSALHFIKNTINFLNPYNTIKTEQNLGTALGDPSAPKVSPLDVIKEMPNEAYKALVPQFLQHIVSGNFDKASQTIQNDPVGQILPLILMGKQAAEASGIGPQYDSAISSIASPVTKPVSAMAGKVAGAAGTVASQILGASTGAGASSIKEAFSNSPAFRDAMRGKIDPEGVVKTAQDTVQNITDARRTNYLGSLKNIGENNKSLDISPIQDTLDKQLTNFGIKVGKDGELDFSRSSIANNGSARADVQGVYDTLKKWGTQEGDRTPVGVDTLKKQLSDFYSPSGSARALVQAVKSKVSGILNDQVPGYSDMTKGYAKASQLLDDIKSATGVGGNSKVDTVFTKMTTAMKGDKELRLEVLKQMQSEGAQPDLMAKIAGTNMQSYIPKGLVGKGIDISSGFAILSHYFKPEFIPMILATSPRIVGEFVNGLGWTSDKVKTITNAVNKYGSKVPTSALGSIPQSQLREKQKQNNQ